LAGQDGPLAVLGTGQALDGSHQHWALRISYWPGGESKALAHADFHGSWLDWF
jgi:hypothetical protein